MEGINNRENFESFKNRIAETFQKEGLSENLKSEIEIWKKRKYEETDTPGGTIEQRVIFQVELAELYIAVDKKDFARETLSDVYTQAEQEMIEITRKTQSAATDINYLINIKRDDLLVTPAGEIEKILKDKERLDNLILKIIDLMNSLS